MRRVTQNCDSFRKASYPFQAGANHENPQPTLTGRIVWIRTHHIVRIHHVVVIRGRVQCYSPRSVNSLHCGIHRLRIRHRNGLNHDRLVHGIGSHFGHLSRNRRGRFGNNDGDSIVCIVVDGVVHRNNMTSERRRRDTVE